VLLGVQKFAVGVSLNNQAPPQSPEARKAVGQDIGLMSLVLQVDGKGNLSGKKTDLSKVPPASREILEALGEQLQESFDAVAIPLPGGSVQPGQSWKARRELPLDLPGGTQAGQMEVTYTYRGLRQHNGREVAVLDLRGEVSGSNARANLYGRTSGSAVVDPATGMVLQANALVDAVLTVRYREETFEAKGTLEVKLSRGPDVK
jgi:hypothetical protein